MPRGEPGLGLRFRTATTWCRVNRALSKSNRALSRSGHIQWHAASTEVILDVGNLGRGSRRRATCRYGKAVTNFRDRLQRRKAGRTSKPASSSERTEWHNIVDVRPPRRDRGRVPAQGLAGLRRRQAPHAQVAGQGRQATAGRPRSSPTRCRCSAAARAAGVVPVPVLRVGRQAESRGAERTAAPAAGGDRAAPAGGGDEAPLDDDIPILTHAGRRGLRPRSAVGQNQPAVPGFRSAVRPRCR